MAAADEDEGTSGDQQRRRPGRGPHQPLLTPTSVALSLSPPRVPPEGSVLRRLYARPGDVACRDRFRSELAARLRRQRGRNYGDGDDRSDEGYGEGEVGDSGEYRAHTLGSRLVQLFIPSSYSLRHPHLPTSLSLPDQMTRFIGATLTLESQHAFRDGGKFRSVADSMVTLSCPLLGIGHPSAAREFLELSLAGGTVGQPKPKPRGGEMVDGNAMGSGVKRRRRRWTRRRIRYGGHGMQFVDVFLPGNANDDDSPSNKLPVRGTLFFVHGGAWGSGRPWMYRLVAPSFLKLNFAVAVIGYRTYPDARTIDEQCGDVRSAWEACGEVLGGMVEMVPSRNDNDGSGGNDSSAGWVGNVVMGHSSGAHVALLMLVDWIGERARAGAMPATPSGRRERYLWTPDCFVGLSGPYDISHHFDYEAGRGVEQISPMKPICGHTREGFRKANPVARLQSLLREVGDHGNVQHLAPPVLLVHGVEDSTVPFTATTDAGRALRACGLEACDEAYLEGTGHQDVVMHFMLGGRAKELVLDWLLRPGRRRKKKTDRMCFQSRL